MFHCVSWWDDARRCHEIVRAESMEQCDSTALALFGFAANSWARHAGTTPEDVLPHRAYAILTCFYRHGRSIVHQDFTWSCTNDRPAEERRMLAQLPFPPDLKCAWCCPCSVRLPVFHAFSAACFRPQSCNMCERAPDDGVPQTLQDMLGGQAGEDKQLRRHACNIAFPPPPSEALDCGMQEIVRQNVLGGMSECTPVLHQHCPEAAACCPQELPSMPAASAVVSNIWRAGRLGECEARDGKALALRTSFREQVLMPAAGFICTPCCNPRLADARAWFVAIPTDAAGTFAPDLMQLLHACHM